MGSILRHRDLKREDRIKSSADAAASFVKINYVLDEDESLPELSEWSGYCEDLHIKIRAKTKEACEKHMQQAVISELFANQNKAYEILLKNKQHQFFL